MCWISLHFSHSSRSLMQPAELRRISLQVILSFPNGLVMMTSSFTPPSFKKQQMWRKQKNKYTLQITRPQIRPIYICISALGKLLVEKMQDLIHIMHYNLIMPSLYYGYGLGHTLSRCLLMCQDDEMMVKCLYAAFNTGKDIICYTWREQNSSDPACVPSEGKVSSLFRNDPKTSWVICIMGWNMLWKPENCGSWKRDL